MMDHGCSGLQSARRGGRLVTQSGLLLEASSVDSVGRRSHAPRRPATPSRAAIYRLTLSDPADCVTHGNSTEPAPLL